MASSPWSLLRLPSLWYVLNHTAWGRHVYAIGDDPEAAKLSGVSTKQHAHCGLRHLPVSSARWPAGSDRPHRLGFAAPPGSSPISNSITAVVIGGISLFGGRGSILGMLFGALIVGVFSFGLRWSAPTRNGPYLLIGVLIILAVAIDQWIRKVAG